METDSAGIRIVESRAPSWGPGQGWVVTDSPVVDLSWRHGAPYDFFRPEAGLRLVDGRLVVADGGSLEVRFFGADGEFVTKVGGRGEGPGEFLRIATLSRFRGDSIVAFDLLLSRATVLGPGGEVGRVVPLHAVAAHLNRFQSYADSEFVAFGLDASALDGSARGRYRNAYTLLLLGPSGELGDTLGVVAGFEGFAFDGGDMSVPFGHDGHLAVHGAKLVIGDADLLAFDEYRNGALARRIRVPGFDVRLTRTDLDLVHRALSGQGMPPQLQDAMHGIPIPESKPAYSSLLIDAEDCVWAEEYRARGAPDGPRTWQVFSPTGEWLGGVRLPARFEVFEIGRDRVLGVRRDALDLEHVQVLKLDRT